jgi:hypothetical protein
MATISSQPETTEQEQEEFTTVLTIFADRVAHKFPGHPSAVVHSLSSIAQTSTKDISNETQRYYFPSSLPRPRRVFLQRQPYLVKDFKEQLEELRANDIAVYTLAHSLIEQSVGLAQLSASVRRGKFLPSLQPSSSSHFSQLQPELQEPELDEEQSTWRGVFPLLNSTEVVFSQSVEIKLNELPDWKPNIVIDSYRLEDDDE